MKRFDPYEIKTIKLTANEVNIVRGLINDKIYSNMKSKEKFEEMENYMGCKSNGYLLSEQCERSIEFLSYLRDKL